MNEDKQPISKEEVKGIVKEHLVFLERLPQHAMLSPINNYDYHTLLSLIYASLEVT